MKRLDVAETDAVAALLHREAIEAGKHENAINGRGDVSPGDKRVARDRHDRLTRLAREFQTARNGDATVVIVPRGQALKLAGRQGEVTILLPAEAEVVARAAMALGKAGFEGVEPA